MNTDVKISVKFFQSEIKNTLRITAVMIITEMQWYFNIHKSIIQSSRQHFSRFNNRTHRIFSTNWENGFAEFTILLIKVLKKLQIRSSISQSNKGFITYKKKRVTTTTTILNREKLIALLLKSEMRQGCQFILLPFSIQFKILLRVIRPESDFVTYVWFHGFLHPWQKPS